MIELRIVILTTETPHHIYFVKELSSYFEIKGVAVETLRLTPPFKTYHHFENEREIYEKQELLQGADESFVDYCDTRAFESINGNDCTTFISGLNPDVNITFGTGIVKPHLIRLCPNGFINLHGGNPEYYRGLDTQLWAIYHREFEQLVVTLHRLNPQIDDGDIIQKAQIKIKNNSKIHELRSENTKLCVQLTIAGLSTFDQLNTFISYPQQKRGRYYSFMPADIKTICVNNFEKYVSKL